MTFLAHLIVKKVIGAGLEAKEAIDTGESFEDVHARHKAEKQMKKIKRDIKKNEHDIAKAKREHKAKDVYEKTAELEGLKEELAMYEADFAPTNEQTQATPVLAPMYEADFAPTNEQTQATPAPAQTHTQTQAAPVPAHQAANHNFKFCTECGVKNTREAHFCQDCGHRFS
ncbi:expressed unknown protein [Seminavis robusta]|uniref:Zinc-ribbon domain-containing protein n=1 Tax=Seminavis robusta TaxID=568900 RepID=A0A9N8DA31_9STRA|nr:expressed unknown protein [Seminavis robusta]|eukprot:Sro47_g027990.1 n/a (171) ;mRNA; f:142061-142688